jgi:pSer/pThr/pTyr-binding forkhead associated (FHA) protein
VDLPRAILAVQWGPQRGKRAVLHPGASLRVGRAEWADLKVPNDRQMSGVHFEVAWDGARATVRDLKSVTGTLIDGEPGLAEGAIANGGWIKAGETVFTLFVEGATPPREDAGEIDDDTPGLQGAARRREAEARRERMAAAQAALPAIEREAASGALYALLDGARDERILELCHESVEEYQSLYDGVAGEAMSDVAPRLVRLPAGSRLLEALVLEGWGKRWGVYAVCPLPFKEVRRHFRRLLMVQEEETAERMYFRFYDPRVLAAFLDCATAPQADAVFGEITAYVVEAADRSVRRLPRPAKEGEV